MTAYLNPQIALLPTWEASHRMFITKLKNEKIVKDKTFSFEDFLPVFDWTGMTISGLSVGTANVLRIGSLVFLHVNAGVTLAAPLATVFSFTIPYTAKSNFAGAVRIDNAVFREIGNWACGIGTNIVFIRRPAAVAYTATASAFNLSCWIEVI